MPISSIPMPKQGYEELDLNGTINQFLQNRRANQQLAVQQAANARAQQLLPHMLKKYENEEQKSAFQQQMAKDLFGPQNGQNTPNAPAAPNQAGASPEENKAVSQVNPEINPEEKPEVHDEVHKNLKSVLSDGQEITVKRGDPNRERWDRVAGQTIFGMKIPDVKSKVVDGMQYDTYPSGKVVATKGGPNTEEKAEIGLNVAERREESKAHVKQNTEAETSGTSLAKSARYLRQLKQILEENPGLTGPGASFSSKLGLSKNKQLGKFKEISGKLQAEIGKYASQRGGIQSVNWAASVKPDIGNQPEMNLGMIEAALEGIGEDYKDISDQYGKRNKGKRFPVELPGEEKEKSKEKENGITKVIDGTEYKMIDGEWHKRKK
jgi:hypothetical protein